MKQLVLALALASATAGCTAEQIMTPEQITQLEAMDTSIQEAAKAAKAAEDGARAALAAIGKAVKSGDATAILTAMQTFESAKVGFETYAAELDVEYADRDAFIQEAIDKRTGPFTGIVSGLVKTFFPAAAPVVGWLDALTLPIAALFFKRPRKRAAVMAGNLLKGRLGDVVGDLGKYVGFMHSNSDPAKVLVGARKAALEAGDTAMAATIETIIPPGTAV